MALAATAASRARAADLHAGYLDSRARCKHGEDGLLINVHPSTTARAFRDSLEGRAPSHPHNRFRHTDLDGEWTHVRSLPMLSIHSSMFEAVLTHEHTIGVEANCVIKADVPKLHKPPEFHKLFI